MQPPKKSQTFLAVIYLQLYVGCENSGYAEKKTTFYAEQDSKQGKVYLEKIKASAKESFVYLVHIDEPDIPTQMYCQYALSSRRKRAKTRISGKRHPRIGLIAAHVKALCLPRTPAAER